MASLAVKWGESRLELLWQATQEECGTLKTLGGLLSQAEARDAETLLRWNLLESYSRD